MPTDIEQQEEGAEDSIHDNQKECEFCNWKESEKTNVYDRENIEYKHVPIDEEWRINMLEELIMVKHGERAIEHFSEEEIEEIIEFVCSS